MSKESKISKTKETNKNMNYYVFQVAEVNEMTAYEWFKNLVVDKNVWGFGPHAANYKAIHPGDKVIFYLTGTNNQVFVGSAELKSGAYEDKTNESKDWFHGTDILRIDLDKVSIFAKPKVRHDFKSLGWKPVMGSSSRISERDYNIILGIEPDVFLVAEKPQEEMEFILEKYLEDFIWDNWDKIDFGEKLEKFIDEDGNEGKQYYTEDAGYIDILAKDSKGNFVVFELKKGRKNDEVVGQILRYTGWVRKNLVKKGEDVRGIIVVGTKDPKLEYALSEITDKVSAKLYRVSFRLENYS
jgi:hypothetical protein